MTESIKLHPEHGVNASLGVCFWCGEEDGNILLLGLNGGKQAPRRTIVGYEPCDKCKPKMDSGILLMEARRDEPWVLGGTPMAEQDGAKIYPSGRWAVITPEAAKEFFHGTIVDKILAEGRTFVDTEAWDVLGFDKIGAKDVEPS